MTAQAQQLTRVFKFGAMELEDPEPSLSPEAAMRMYEKGIPALANSSISEGVVDGDRLIFEIKKPQGKTKG